MSLISDTHLKIIKHPKTTGLMNTTKQLYKIALISSPLMVAFELSSIFFLIPHPSINLFLVIVLFILSTIIIWVFNIYITTLHKKKTRIVAIKNIIWSFLFVFLVLSIMMVITDGIFQYSKQNPPKIYAYINIATLNAIILVIINSVITRTKNEQITNELALLKLKNLEAEHQQLIKQMHPHFLFNALSTLKSLINSNAEKAEEYLVYLSDFLRFSISTNTNSIVFLQEELAFTKGYIELQKIRYMDSFFYDINVPDHVLESYLIPIYGIQTLVENAFKHNAFSALKPLHISILFKDGRVVVKNNKQPKVAENSSGIALENLNKRFLLIGEKPIIIDNQPDYYSVTFNLINK